jgi:hypothetical protein
MGSENQKDKEKLFSENIDNLLAGSKPGPDTSIGEDERESLAFAGKMIDSTPVPSPVFESRLKSKLLQKLAEREEKQKTQWVWGFIPRQPAMQAAVSALALVVIAGAAVLVSHLNQRETLVTSLRTTSTTTATATTMTSATTSTTAAMVSAPSSGESVPGAQNTLQVDAYLSNSKTTFTPGEAVQLIVSLKNTTAEPVTLEQFPPMLSIMQAETRQPVRTFESGKVSKTLMPRESIIFQIYWDELDDSRRPVTGEFYIELEDADYFGKALKLTLTSPVTFSIQTGAGNIGSAYETVIINQSVTVNGITVILQNLHLSANGAVMTAYVSAPPDYNKNPGSRNFAAFASYYLDSGWVKYAGLSTVGYHPADMKHTWYLPEAIPPDTRELLFVVTSIGSWEGPWQFTIQLGQ